MENKIQQTTKPKFTFLPENNECEGWWKSRMWCDVFHVYIGTDPMWKQLVDLGLAKQRKSGRSEFLCPEFSLWKLLLEIMMVFSDVLPFESIAFWKIESSNRQRMGCMWVNEGTIPIHEAPSTSQVLCSVLCVCYLNLSVQHLYTRKLKLWEVR